MPNGAIPLNPAEVAGQQALDRVYTCLQRGESFRMEAGAGAGKTYSLVKALQFLIRHDKDQLLRHHQKIACITFTNVAKDEIEARTDKDPVVHCNTIHAFCWSLIGRFQKQLRERLPNLNHWPERIEEVGELGERVVEYTLGHRYIKDDLISIHHDDVLLLTIDLMGNEKFRRIITGKYPVILIDEYQDANAGWIDSIMTHFLGQPNSPQFGFFGDHWQKIYGDGCGKIDHPSLTVINKEANFRSVSTIVACLNRMRPELPQFVVDPGDAGSVIIFHTNNWNGVRRKGPHWSGDLPIKTAHDVLQMVKNRLVQKGWALEKTKILMLTHRVLANEQDYSSLPGIFSFNNAFTKKEHGHIAFLVDKLEPACDAFIARQYGKMFEVLIGNRPMIKCQVDKTRWSTIMETLINIRTNGTVGEVIIHLRANCQQLLPDSVEQPERELEQFDGTAVDEIPRASKELADLHAVQYTEIMSLRKYLEGHSPFETKHGVKGAEFENVLVVAGRGWDDYDFNKMLEWAPPAGRIPLDKQNFFELNRNLFYVVCSRPKRRLAILFTQKLSAEALRTVNAWFGVAAVEALVI